MTQTNSSTVNQPIDFEALPLPFHQAPALIQTLVKQLPDCWQQTAALALLPALSVACGNINYGADNKPLAFHVALYGRNGTGKSQFSCKPARVVQNYLARNDDANFDTDNKATSSPRVLGFQISTVQLCKYLKKSPNETVMLYTDEISQSIGNERSSNSFMSLHDLLRSAYDSVEYIQTFKDKDSFRGTLKPRLSFLACGTPNSIFKYFDAKAIESGTTRRVIFVEHPRYEEIIDDVAYTEEQLDYIKQEIEWLEMQSGKVHLPSIEEAVLKWREDKLASIDMKDVVKRDMVNTPYDTFRRAAYLAWVLNHHEDVNNAIAFGEWVAEYMFRSALFHTYPQQHAIAEEGQKHFAQSSQTVFEDFNQTMLNDLPLRFSWQDVLAYRKDHNYSGAHKSRVILTRWKNRGKIKQIKRNTFIKL